MQQLILILHVVICAGLIGLVLMQQGKGAEAGASFGAGASQTLFGSQGSGSFLGRLTAILAALFFATCLLLGYLSAQQVKHTQDPLADLPVPTANQAAPAEPASQSIEQQIPDMEQTKATNPAKETKK